MLRTTVTIALTVVLAFALAGCGGTDGDATDATVAEESGPTADDAAQAFEAMHPGYTAEAVEGGPQQWFVDGRSTDVPAFVVRTGVVPAAGGDVTATVDATEWSASNGLQEVTENAQLMPGTMRVQFMETVVADMGWSAEDSAGQAVTSVGVISNVEMRASIEGGDGGSTDRFYKLDLASGTWVPK